MCYFCLVETAVARRGIELPLLFSFRLLMCGTNVHTFWLENRFLGTVFFTYVLSFHAWGEEQNVCAQDSQ